MRIGFLNLIFQNFFNALFFYILFNIFTQIQFFYVIYAIIFFYGTYWISQCTHSHLGKTVNLGILQHKFCIKRLFSNIWTHKFLFSLSWGSKHEYYYSIIVREKKACLEIEFKVTISKVQTSTSFCYQGLRKVEAFRRSSLNHSSYPGF